MSDQQDIARYYSFQKATQIHVFATANKLWLTCQLQISYTMPNTSHGKILEKYTSDLLINTDLSMMSDVAHH